MGPKNRVGVTTRTTTKSQKGIRAVKASPCKDLMRSCKEKTTKSKTFHQKSDLLCLLREFLHFLCIIDKVNLTDFKHTLLVFFNLKRKQPCASLGDDENE